MISKRWWRLGLCTGLSGLGHAGMVLCLASQAPQPVPAPTADARPQQRSIQMRRVRPGGAAAAPAAASRPQASADPSTSGLAARTTAPPAHPSPKPTRPAARAPAAAPRPAKLAAAIAPQASVTGTSSADAGQPPATTKAAAPSPPSFGLVLSAEADGGPEAGGGDGSATGGPAGGDLVAPAGRAGERGTDAPGPLGGPADFDVPPRMLGACAARYPQSPEARGRYGQVKVEVHIAADGSISRIDIIQSLGPAFDREALAAMRTCRYAPATLAGRPVATVIEHKFTFKADDSS